MVALELERLGHIYLCLAPSHWRLGLEGAMLVHSIFVKAYKDMIELFLHLGLEMLKLRSLG